MDNFKLSIKSVLGEEKRVLSKLDQLFESESFCKEDCNEVKSAVAEACVNAIEHGNLQSPDLDVRIHICIHPDKVSAVIADHGLGPKSFEERRPSSERGWGLFFISQFTDYYCSYFLKEQTIFYMVKKMRKDKGAKLYND